jgi:hypothetical protein
MPHQVALTVVAPIRPGARSALERALHAAGAGGSAEAAVPFAQMTGVHFARLFLLPADVSGAGDPLPERLILMSDVDAPLERHLSELCDLGGPSLDAILRHCERYPKTPDPVARRTYLERHAVSAATAYINTVGRGLDQVLFEQRLRDALERYLDEHRNDLTGRPPLQIRERIREFIAADPDLRPALHRAAPPDLRFRIGEAIHLVLVPAGVVALSPILLVAFPIGVVVLRIHEERDREDRRRPDDAWVDMLASLEDHSIQNPFVASGPLKPGPFRRTLTTVVLGVAGYAVRHVFNHANLAGVKTIHFARWVFLDDKRRVVFASSYDGSVESYMDDFIDKVAWGLNATFSNGVGYPKTRWLFFGGAKNERVFKDVLRRHQQPVQVWYSAYPNLTARNLNQNERLRAGLSGAMSAKEAAAWLQLL